MIRSAGGSTLHLGYDVDPVTFLRQVIRVFGFPKVSARLVLPRLGPDPVQQVWICSTLLTIYDLERRAWMMFCEICACVCRIASIVLSSVVTDLRGRKYDIPPAAAAAAAVPAYNHIFK